MNNQELIMRINSGVQSGDLFFTDLNGFQMVIFFFLVKFSSNFSKSFCEFLQRPKWSLNQECTVFYSKYIQLILFL